MSESNPAGWWTELAGSRQLFLVTCRVALRKGLQAWVRLFKMSFNSQHEKTASNLFCKIYKTFKSNLICGILLHLFVKLISLWFSSVHPSELTSCLSSMGNDSFSACKVPVLGDCSYRAHKGYFCLNCITIKLGSGRTFRMVGRKGRKRNILIDGMEHMNIFQVNQIKRVFISCPRIFYVIFMI